MEITIDMSQRVRRRPFRRRGEHCYHKHHQHQQQHDERQHEPQDIISTTTATTTTTTSIPTSKLSSAISHYLPATTTTTTTTTTNAAEIPRCGAQLHRRATTKTSQKLRYSSSKAGALLMYLSIVACVTMSLLNLTSPILHAGALLTSSSGAPSSSQMSTSQAAAMSQQQSNSVIQYPATAATTATTAVKARYKTMYACEDRQLSMDCEGNSKINLIRANFGRFSITQCNEQGQLDLQTDCMSPITFRIMQEKCQDKQRCSVNATSLIFGDKCPKTRKYLEVHFQCQTDEPDVVDVRKPLVPQVINPQSPYRSQSPVSGPILGPSKPANNPAPPPRTMSQPNIISGNSYQPAYQEEQNNSPSSSESQQTQAQLPTPVINSPLMSSVNAINDPANNKLDFDNREPVMISLRHLQVENMSRPRCYQWDSLSNQWTERGARMLETNQTHTLCAFDTATSYVLVMDYSGPMQTISPMNSNGKQNIAMSQPSANPIFNSPPPDFLENRPVPIDSYSQPGPFMQPNQFDINKMIHAPTPNGQQQQQQQQPQQQSTSTKLFALFGYLLAIIFVVMGLLTLAFAASSMRTSAGAAFKSLGNFAPFNGPKYNKRRQGHLGPNGLHSNKDLLVINNSNGHQFIYAPASSTKISSSPSTHILSTSQAALAGQHQGTLHRAQQQQMYSGNGATLSSLSGTGAQSNNYYYGLMGLNPLFQQQQSHHFSQHHLNQQQQQAHQQTQIAANYNHQANKSTISAESANSSSSSSGVESSSTSMQQQQQAQTQQACLVSTSGNQNDFNLMGHHISSNYGQHQQQNMFAHQHQQQQQQLPGALTLNAHYSTSGGMQTMNMSLHNRQASGQLRDHIYECVDDDKPYMARLLMPANNEQPQQQQFGTLGHHQFSQQASNNSRAMTLSSRLLQDVFQQQQQQQNQNCSPARRNFPQTAIVRDHQAAKTNIICSKVAQVTPQRATEIGGKSSQQQQQQPQFAHTDVMAIYNKDDATTMTAAHQQQQPTSTNNSCYGQRLDTNMALNSQGKLSTDC